MAISKRPLRFIALADLHDCSGRLERLRTVDADLIAFCGDLHNGGSRETALPTALALSRIGPPVIIVPGNMDHKDFVPDLWKETGLKMLHGSSLMWGKIGFIFKEYPAACCGDGQETVLRKAAYSACND